MPPTLLLFQNAQNALVRLMLLFFLFAFTSCFFRVTFRVCSPLTGSMAGTSGPASETFDGGICDDDGAAAGLAPGR